MQGSYLRFYVHEGQRHKRRLSEAVLDGGAGPGGALSERDIDDLLAPLAY